MILGIVGNIISAIAVVTMQDSWRAGIAEEDNREMVTSGIYKISRNPAVFDEDHISYKKCVCRYLGRKE